MDFSGESGSGAWLLLREQPQTVTRRMASVVRQTRIIAEKPDFHCAILACKAQSGARVAGIVDYRGVARGYTQKMRRIFLFLIFLLPLGAQPEFYLHDGDRVV